jgi:O-antigen/teichoic acid export membrane protein
MMSRLSAILPKGRVSRGVVALASGTMVAQLVTVCAMPIVTRLYTPAEIGVISLFIAFFGFWSPLLSLRYESALLVATDDLESHYVFKVGAGCVILMSLLSAPIFYALIKKDMFGFGLMPTWTALAGVLIFLGFGSFMMYRSWGLRGGFIKDISKATIARSVSNALVRIIFGFFGAGILGLFAAEIAGAWGATGALRRSIKKRYSENRPMTDWVSLKKVAKRYAKFAKYEMPSVAVNQLALVLPVPIVAALYGASAAGWFGLAKMLVAVPNAQLGRAVADVFQMELARYIREGNHLAAYQLFFKLLRKLGLFGLLPLAGVILFAPLVVPWVFGKPWAEMGIISAYIAPWLYASLVVTSLSRLLSVLERQEYKLIYDISGVLLVVAIYLISRRFGLSLDLTVILLSTAGVLSYLIYLMILIHIVRKDLRLDMGVDAGSK